MIGKKVYENDDLMYLIFQYDSTHIEKHKLLMKETLLSICEKSHFFWYDRYEKSLKECRNIKNILDFQDAFFDTLEQLRINY